MNSAKRALGAVAALALCVGMTACGAGQPVPAPTTTATTTTTTTTVTTTTTTTVTTTTATTTVSKTKAATTTAPKTTAKPAIPRDYLADALIVGDSRAEGFRAFGVLRGVGTEFFTKTSLHVGTLWSTKMTVGNLGEVNLETLLKKKQYGKIYIITGVNELGIYGVNGGVRRYGETVDKIRALQPQAKIFICANLHATKSKSEKDPKHSTAKLKEFNEQISIFADELTVFYLDVNIIFDDETGNLPSKYSSDGLHVSKSCYVKWADWLCTEGVR